jgi:hypothetical protein
MAENAQKRTERALRLAENMAAMRLLSPSPRNRRVPRK